METILTTLLLCLLLSGAVFLALRKMKRDRKAGKTCCGGCCTCSGKHPCGKQ